MNFTKYDMGLIINYRTINKYFSFNTCTTISRRMDNRKKYVLFFLLFFISTVIPSVRAEEVKSNKFDALVKEAQALGFKDTTIENIIRLTYILIQSTPEDEKNLERLRNKIAYVDVSDKQVTEENIIDSIKQYDGTEKIGNREFIYALRIYPDIPNKENPLEFDELEEKIQYCTGERFSDVVDVISVLAEIDKQRAFKLTDVFMQDKDIDLMTKVRISSVLRKWDYTGGYVILKDAILSESSAIQTFIPLLISYFKKHDLETITNSDQKIDMRSLLEEVERIKAARQKQGSK